MHYILVCGTFSCLSCHITMWPLSRHWNMDCIPSLCCAVDLSLPTCLVDSSSSHCDMPHVRVTSCREHLPPPHTPCRFCLPRHCYPHAMPLPFSLFMCTAFDIPHFVTAAFCCPTPGFTPPTFAFWPSGSERGSFMPPPSTLTRTTPLPTAPAPRYAARLHLHHRGWTLPRRAGVCAVSDFSGRQQSYIASGLVDNAMPARSVWWILP